MARKSGTRNVLLIIILVFAGIGGYTVWTEYGAPAYNVVSKAWKK